MQLNGTAPNQVERADSEASWHLLKIKQKIAHQEERVGGVEQVVSDVGWGGADAMERGGVG